MHLLFRGLFFFFNNRSVIFSIQFVGEKSSINIENKGELLLGKKEINRYHLVAFFN